MKILICIAGLPYAEPTLRFGRLVAEVLGGEVTVLTVMAANEDREKAEKTLDRAKEMLAGLAIATLIRTGSPSEEILRESEEGAYNLVVIGAKDKPSLAEFVLGSVAVQVLTHARCSVLVVKGDRISLSKILVCSGGKAYAEPAIEMGTQIAEATGARVTLLHVTAPVPAMYTGLEEIEERLVEFLQADTPQAKHLKRGAEILESHSVKGELKLRHGVPEEEIQREAQKGDFDLVVLGSSRVRGPLVNYFWGDVARSVVNRVKRPVLVVRQ
ncbi:MAG: universal stress protein [Anaerolineae bacterium]